MTGLTGACTQWYIRIPVKKQVKILAASDAEHQRWKAEAKRRGQTVTMLIRAAVNKEIGAWGDEQAEQRKAVG